jgi:hypothetical protein
LEHTHALTVVLYLQVLESPRSGDYEEFCRALLNVFPTNQAHKTAQIGFVFFGAKTLAKPSACLNSTDSPESKGSYPHMPRESRPRRSVSEE